MAKGKPGKPNPGTPKDRRLRENKRKREQKPKPRSAAKKGRR